jgi:cyclopropane fatty-acyl-phospholipid synthase-like methyltransferase
MEASDRKKHWENIYQTKDFKDVSWYQEKPETSLSFLKEFNVPKNAKIIDIGGGDSYLVDNLLDLGYEDITVLDISAKAIEKAQQRLGERATSVKWIVADAAKFKPKEKYDFWHDRAAFHFFTVQKDVSNYIKIIKKNISKDGILILGTFSEEGPTKCSGIEIKQYSETSMTEKLNKFFQKVKCITVNHVTPFETIQNFVFCSFKKITTA